MSSTKLRRELLDDPLTRGYGGMTPDEVLANLSDESSRGVANRTSITAPELYDAIVRGEFKALPPDEQDEVKVLLRIQGDIPVGSGSKARSTLTTIFPAGSTTRINLLALLTGVTQSRMKEIGLNPKLSASDIAAARLPDQPSGPPVLNP